MHFPCCALGTHFPLLEAAFCRLCCKNLKMKIRNYPGVCILAVKSILFKGLNGTKQLRPFGSSPDFRHLQSDLKSESGC